MKTPTIYGFCNGMDYSTKLYIGTAVTEEGEVLHSVLCRSEPEMAKGLGMDGRSRALHAKYLQRFPSGFAVEFVPWKHTAQHTGLGSAIAQWRAVNNTLHGNGFIKTEHN